MISIDFTTPTSKQNSSAIQTLPTRCLHFFDNGCSFGYLESIFVLFLGENVVRELFENGGPFV